MRRILLIAAAISLLGAAAACTDDSGLPEPASSPRPNLTASPTVDEVEQEILAAYHGGVAAEVAAQQAGDQDHPELASYFIEGTPAWHDVRNTIVHNQARGMYYAGDLLVVSAEVVELDLDAKPPEATVEACFDDSGYQLVNREDDAPVPDVSDGGRFTVTSTVWRDTDDRWYTVDSTAHWDEAC